MRTSDTEVFVAAPPVTSGLKTPGCSGHFWHGKKPCPAETYFVRKMLTEFADGVAKAAHYALLAEDDHGVE